MPTATPPRPTRITAPAVRIEGAAGASRVVLACEHASAHVPAELDGLGLTEAAARSHAAWDPGALPVARGMARQLDAALVAAPVSRLVHDCNRPPGTPEAMPARSEIFVVPGNEGLTEAEVADRVAAVHRPFHAALAEALAARPGAVLVTVHSFTPVFDGRRRMVEIGVLHDADARLADAMLRDPAATAGHVVRRNAPYGPGDGVTHTLRVHALPRRRLNVMLEIRSDLIADAAAQDAMARMLAGWLARALETAGAASCTA